MEQADHRHEHVVHGHMRRRGDERTGFRHMLKPPRAHLTAVAEHHVAAGQQPVRSLGVLRFDFRRIGRSRSGRKVTGGIDQMMRRRQFRHLRVA